MLKQLILAKKIEERKASMVELRAEAEKIREREAGLKQREAELETAVSEVTSETSKEDRDVLDAAVAEYEADAEAIAADESASAEKIGQLENDIRQLQGELEEINKKAAPGKPADEREEDVGMVENKRMKFFGDVSHERRAAMFERDDVKEFMARAREMIANKRAVTGGELNIPDVLLGVLRDSLHKYSKLIGKVRLVRVPGTARQNVAGAIPEAVWTEACANLNELIISFAQIEVDGYKVGGYIPVCNALLEDSDVNLADEIFYNIGQGIGLAVDKAILYGTGTKMPVGIVTRLAEETKPSYWGANAATWTDLHTSNIIKINPGSLTPEQLFSTVVENLGLAKANYSGGGKFFAMSSKTYAKLQAKALVINSAGAIVSGQTQTMPVIGGDIVLLDFIPDNDIVGGYGDLYLLAERAGASLRVSEHVKFIEDQTVFAGTARYDGRPVFGEGFVAININNVNVTTSASFASDTANP